jgi:cytochrome b
MNVKEARVCGPIMTPTALLVHLGLVVCGISAVCTGLLAGDYKRAEHLGFTVHSWIGIAGSLVIVLRVVLGIIGPSGLQFKNWVPFTRERFILVKDDLQGLLHRRLPLRQPHAGLAGLVQILGLLVFLMSALSGLFLFFTIEPGHKSYGLVHDVKEVHEAGLILLLFFFLLHVGPIVLHALAGRHLWRRIFFLKPLPNSK